MKTLTGVVRAHRVHFDEKGVAPIKLSRIPDGSMVSVEMAAPTKAKPAAKTKDR